MRAQVAQYPTPIAYGFETRRENREEGPLIVMLLTSIWRLPPESLWDVTSESSVKEHR